MDTHASYNNHFPFDLNNEEYAVSLMPGEFLSERWDF